MSFLVKEEPLIWGEFPKALFCVHKNQISQIMKGCDHAREQVNIEEGVVRISDIPNERVRLYLTTAILVKLSEDLK